MLGKNLDFDGQSYKPSFVCMFCTCVLISISVWYFWLSIWCRIRRRKWPTFIDHGAALVCHLSFHFADWLVNNSHVLMGLGFLEAYMTQLTLSVNFFFFFPFFFWIKKEEKKAPTGCIMTCETWNLLLTELYNFIELSPQCMAHGGILRHTQN